MRIDPILAYLNRPPLVRLLRKVAWLVPRALTRRLRLGNMINVLPFYDPLRLAEEITMLDHLTHGRLNVGIGSGVQREYARRNPHRFAAYGEDRWGLTACDGPGRAGPEKAAESERADLCIVNTCTVTGEGDAKSRAAVRKLHLRYTGSDRGRYILQLWEDMVPKFVKVMPKDYQRVLTALKKANESGLSGDDAITAAFEENSRDVARIGGG